METIKTIIKNLCDKKQIDTKDIEIKIEKIKQINLL